MKVYLVIHECPDFDLYIDAFRRRSGAWSFSRQLVRGYERDGVKLECDCPGLWTGMNDRLRIEIKEVSLT